MLKMSNHTDKVTKKQIRAFKGELGSIFTYTSSDNPDKSGAKRFNSGKPRLSLIPPASQERMAEVLQFGADKYGDNNWRKGGEKLSLLSVLDSMKRHILAIEKGEDLDEESGLDHIGHVLCNAAFIAQLKADGTLIDDRYKK